MSDSRLSTEKAQALEENLQRSLSQIRETSGLLDQMESAVPTASPERLDELLAILQQMQESARELAVQRASLLPSSEQSGKKPTAETVLACWPKLDQPRLSAFFHDLRKSLAGLRRHQERVWTLLSVRSCVIDMTLRVLTGGSSRGYEASGERSVSHSRPILEHRC